MSDAKLVKLDILIKLSKMNNFNINQSLNIKKYIPFEEKTKHINDFVLSIVDDNGNYNSMDKYFKFTMLVFNVYTNLQLDNTCEEYDKLINSGLFDLILQEIENDYYDFKEFMEMRFNDVLREKYSNNHK